MRHFPYLAITIFFRTGRKQVPGHLVGIDAKIGDLTSVSSEDETPYFPPSHWSTNNLQTANRNLNTKDGLTDENQENTRKAGAKAINNNGSFLKNGKYYSNHYRKCSTLRSFLIFF